MLACSGGHGVDDAEDGRAVFERLCNPRIRDLGTGRVDAAREGADADLIAVVDTGVCVCDTDGVAVVAHHEELQALFAEGVVDLAYRKG